MPPPTCPPTDAEQDLPAAGARTRRADEPAVKGFFARQQRDEGLTSNWFRALSLNEGDLERLNAYLLPLLGTDGRGGLTAREREVIATVVSGENRCAYCHTNHANKLGKVAGDWSFGQRVAIDHHQVAELTDRERALADLAVAVNNDPQSIRDADFAEAARARARRSPDSRGHLDRRVHRRHQPHRHRAVGAAEPRIHRHPRRNDSPSRADANSHDFRGCDAIFAVCSPRVMTATGKTT